MPNCRDCPFPKNHAIHGPTYTSSASSIYTKHAYTERKEVPDMVLDALEAALALHSKDHALDRFDWGKSFLRAEDIQELNELPGQITKAIAEQKRRLSR